MHHSIISIIKLNIIICTVDETGNLNAARSLSPSITVRPGKDAAWDAVSKRSTSLERQLTAYSGSRCVGAPPLQARLQHVLRCVLVHLWQHEHVTWFEDNAVSCIISDLANQGGAPSKRTVFNVLQRLFVRGCSSGRMLPP